MENEAKNKSLSSYLDLAYHKANTTQDDIKQGCEKVISYQFNSIFVNPYYVAYAKEKLNNNPKVGTVVSFPLGQDIFSIKAAMAKQALLDGADELDVMLNVGFIKEHRWEKSYQEMEELVKIVKDFDDTKIIKCIPEMGYLTDDEAKHIAELMVKAGVDFFKTCSGYGPRGSRLEDVILVRHAVGDAIKIKVAGGVSNYAKAKAFIEVGADRIGTSSAVEIIQEN
jgi:deoxyribose-phosphate aldolase